MAGPSSSRRLRKELKMINAADAEGLYVAPLESNLLEWHFVFHGEEGSCYREGIYWGRLVFPKTYPLNAPNVFILTPNGERGSLMWQAVSACRRVAVSACRHARVVHSPLPSVSQSLMLLLPPRALSNQQSTVPPRQHRLPQ